MHACTLCHMTLTFFALGDGKIEQHSVAVYIQRGNAASVMGTMHGPADPLP